MSVLVPFVEKVGSELADVLLEGASKPAVGSSEETTQAFEKQTIKDTIRDVATGKNEPIKNNPLNIIRKKSADIVNDAIIDGLHHIPIFKQIIDGGRAARSGIFDTVEKMHEVGEDAINGEELGGSYRKQFGEEQSGIIDAAHKKLELANYKQSPQEVAQTVKLVKSQRKVFDILHKYEKIAGKGKMTDAMKKAMNDEVTAAYSGKIDGKNIGTFEDNMEAHKRSFINNVYDYPKTGKKITKAQRENVFSAIEKDLDDHNSGSGVQKKYRSTTGKKLSANFNLNHKNLITNNMNVDINKAIEDGSIYINEKGKLKVKGISSGDDAKVGAIATSSYIDMVGDVIANSKRIPEETKKILLEDYRPATTPGGKAIKNKPDLMEGKILTNPTEDIDKNFFRDQQLKTKFEELREEMGDLGDLKSNTTLDNTYGKSVMSKEHLNSLHPINSKNVEKPLLEERQSIPKIKLSDEHKAELDDIGVILTPEGVIKDWNTYSGQSLKDFDKLAREGADIKSPDKLRAQKYIQWLGEKTELTDIQQEFIDRADISGVDYNGKRVSPEASEEFLKFKDSEVKFKDVKTTKTVLPATRTENKPTTIDSFKKPEPVQAKTSGSTITIFKTPEQKLADEKRLLELVEKKGKTFSEFEEQKKLIKEKVKVPEKFTGETRSINETPEQTKASELVEAKKQKRLDAIKENKERNDNLRKVQMAKRQANLDETSRLSNLLSLQQEVNDKYFMSRGEYLDKNIYNPKSIKSKIGLDFSTDEVKQIKGIIEEGDENKLSSLSQSDLSKINNIVTDLTDEQARKLKKAGIRMPAEKDPVVKALESEKGKEKDVVDIGKSDDRSNTPSVSQVEKNKKTGSTFNLEGLESEPETTNPKDLLNIPLDTDLLPDLPDSIVQLKDGSFIIKDIDEFMKIDKESEEYKEIEDIIGKKELQDMRDKALDDTGFADISMDKIGDGSNPLETVFGKSELSEGSVLDKITGNKGAIAGGLGAVGLGGLGIKEGLELAKDVKENADEIIEGKDEITRNGDEIKKRLEGLDDTDGKNINIGQIITHADTQAGDSDIPPKEQEQIKNGMADIKRQIEQLLVLQNSRQSTVNQINEPSTDVGTNNQARRELKNIDRGLEEGKILLDRKSKQLKTDLRILERRKTSRKLQKDAISNAVKQKNKSLENALRSGVLKQSQPVINIINQSKMGTLRNMSPNK